MSIRKTIFAGVGGVLIGAFSAVAVSENSHRNGINFFQEAQPVLDENLSAAFENNRQLNDAIAQMDQSVIALYELSDQLAERAALRCGNQEFAASFSKWSRDFLRQGLRENSRGKLLAPEPIEQLFEEDRVSSYSDLWDQFGVSIEVEDVIALYEDMLENDVSILRSRDLHELGPEPYEEFSGLDTSILMYHPESRIIEIRESLHDLINIKDLYEEIAANNFYEGQSEPVVWISDYNPDYNRHDFVRLDGERPSEDYVVYELPVSDYLKEEDDRLRIINLHSFCPT